MDEAGAFLRKIDAVETGCATPDEAREVLVFAGALGRTALAQRAAASLARIEERGARKRLRPAKVRPARAA